MVNFALGENHPMKAVFYDDLDTVRFSNDVSDKERKARDLAAMGDVMVGMLAGRVAAILSQAQSYDNQLLLTLISPEGGKADRDDMRAFIRLARTGFVRVGLMENGPAADPPDGGRYTLINMLRTSLADPMFLLSGWPELNSNVDLRNEVLDCLNRAPSGRMSAGVPAGIAARVEGLREFDRSLRQSPRGIRIVRQADEPLETRINNMLRIMGADADAVRQAAAKVFEHATCEKMSLNSRSSWYLLIERISQDSDPVQDSALRVLRNIVDLNYNAMVSESLGDDGMSLSAGHENAADTAADEFTPGWSPGKRWADLSPTPGKGNWLRWSDMPDLLADLEVLSPGGRLAELRVRQSEWVTGYETRHSWRVSAKIALPGAVGTAVTGLGTSLITSATPGQAAGVAALAGVATLVAATPRARALRGRNMAREEERLRSRDERSAIRTGAAGWLERMRRSQ